MTSRDNDKRPIIIKRKKVIVAGGHHGGAWKVAYADFVTAMMAFFMLLWLLSSTTDQQRKGIAGYFNPSIAISDLSGGGDGVLGGVSMAADASRVQMGRGGVTESDATGAEAEEATLKDLEEAIVGKGGESLLDREALRHVAVRLTDEGLMIELFDLPGSPLFDGNVPRPLLRRLLNSIGGELRKQPNALAIEAFTAAEPVVMRTPAAWEVSSGRAHAVRRALPAVGVKDARVIRVTGHADRMPIARDPISTRNNRVAIIVLRDRVPPRP